VDGGDVGVVVTIGLPDMLDVLLGLPYAWYSQEENDVRFASEDGISDIKFDAKWRIFEKDGWAVFPTMSRNELQSMQVSSSA